MPKKPEKIELRNIEVKKIVESDISLSLDGDLGNAILTLKKLYTKYPQYYQFELKVAGDYDGEEIQLIGFRLETDAERDQRVKVQTKARETKARKKADKEAAEKAEYERLRAIYGD